MSCGACSLWCRQFWLILWKNVILQARRPIGTIFELLLPPLAVAVMIILRYQLFHPADRCFATFYTFNLQPPVMQAFYTPNTSQVHEVITRANQMFPNVIFTGVTNERDLLSSIQALDKEQFPKYAGVVFPSNLDSPLEEIAITFRQNHEVGSGNTWNTLRQAAIFRGFNPRRGNHYIGERFLHLQNALSLAITQWKLESVGGVHPDNITFPNVHMRQMSFPKYQSDLFLEAIVLALPALVVLSYLYSAGAFVQELVLEKETRLRESMKMMGLKSSALWCSWFIKQFLFLLITGIVITIMMKFGNIFPKSDFGVLLLFVITFLLSLVSFGFFVSSFFSSARVSLFVGFLAWFLILFPYFPLALQYAQLSLGTKLAVCLFSNTCVGFAINIISTLEIHSEGLTWSNAVEPLTTEDHFHLGLVFAMLLLDSLLYILIGWYKEAVFPGTYGVPKPFYFLFQPSYWLGRPLRVRSRKVDTTAAEEVGLHGNSSYHEQEPSNLPIGIGIRHLTKVYKGLFPPRRTTTAVEDLSLNVYQDQITALLGHNGAGKTTTMSILTGLFAPTSGDAVINNHSILTEMDTIRQNLGLCPQHNVLFDRLTVKEHLLLFGMLKGLTGKALSYDVSQLLADVNLSDKSGVVAKQLSGGMKRKLSVALALVGGSQFVVLDEPTSGMDPYARRATWDLLSKYKKGRTIMLSTHFMDEADLLGDRIAILVDGRLLCSGSSLFLKGRFGVGYHLNLVKAEGCDVDALTKLILSTVDGAKKVSEVAGELSFTLPSEQIHRFPELFDSLDGKQEQLRLSSYGVTATSMRDVFMSLTDNNEDLVAKDITQEDAQATFSKGGQILLLRNPCADHAPFQHSSQASEHHDVSAISETTLDLESTTSTAEVVHGKETSLKQDRAPDIVACRTELNSGLLLWLQQLRAMLVKRILNTFRYPGALVAQLLLPVVFVALGLIFLKTLPANISQDPPRSLTLKESSPVENITMFSANFGVNEEVWDNIFDGLDSGLIGVTSHVNITASVYEILSGTSSPNTTAGCCLYEHQFLDNFCLTINTSVYYELLGNCSTNPSFGYRACLDCLDTSVRSKFCLFTRLRPSDPPQTGPLPAMATYVDEFFIRSGETRLLDYVNHYQLGFTAEPSTGGMVDLTVWYNNQNYHTCPSALSSFHNYYMNTLLAHHGVPTSTRPHTVTFTNHPFPRTEGGQLENSQVEYIGFTLSTNIAFAFSFLLGGFTLFLVQERTSKAKHLQLVSGVHITSFWLANFIWDELCCLAIIAIATVMSVAFQIEQFTGENILALVTLMVFLCWAGVPLVYCSSFIFTSQLLAFAVIVMVLYFSSMIMTVVVWQVGVENPDTANTLNYIFLSVPSYSFSHGIDNIFINTVLRSACLASNETQTTCMEEGVQFVDSVFSMEVQGIGINLCVLGLQGVAFLVLTMLMERSFFLPELRRCFCHCKTSTSPTQHETSFGDEDTDVAAERERVMGNSSGADKEGEEEEDVVVLRNLFKSYGRDPRKCFRPTQPAVNGVCVGVSRGECFGLLGTNGAGKTTIFGILTGDLRPSGGSAVILGRDNRSSRKGVQQRIGYCPQFDALLDRLTGVELLTMFARLRGIPERSIPAVVEAEVRRLDVVRDAKKRCGKYSGGNRRKLSTAIALVGSPPILLLDEPTTGMDPRSRQFVWRAVSEAVASGRSVILSSHSMEECEALCTRLAIMVNGQFKCLGSIQHLKSKFGKGYTLKVKSQSQFDDGYRTEVSLLDESDNWSFGMENGQILPRARIRGTPSNSSLATPTSVESFIEDKFPNARLLEAHQNCLTFHLPSEGVRWSKIFRLLEEAKDTLSLEDYSVTQTSLEQVFVAFAMKQLED